MLSDLSARRVAHSDTCCAAAFNVAGRVSTEFVPRQRSTISVFPSPFLPFTSLPHKTEEEDSASLFFPRSIYLRFTLVASEWLNVGLFLVSPSSRLTYSLLC